ncbi:MAG: Lrp/AsnC family transcriptional regulator [Pseudomonadota bacterium]
MRKSEKLDRIDIKILAELQKNGRITNAALADAVGLSQSPCLQRLKRLEASGYVTGYSAQIDIGRLTDSVTVFTEVTLSDHRAGDFSRFETRIASFQEVVECHLVSGGYDYLLKFVCPSVAGYQDTIERILDANLGIEKYFSYIVIKSPMAGRPASISGLLNDA